MNENDFLTQVNDLKKQMEEKERAMGDEFSEYKNEMLKRFTSYKASVDEINVKCINELNTIYYKLKHNEAEFYSIFNVYSYLLEIIIKNLNKKVWGEEDDLDALGTNEFLQINQKYIMEKKNQLYKKINLSPETEKEINSILHKHIFILRPYNIPLDPSFIIDISDELEI